MATNTDTEILKFEIEAGDAISEQEKLKTLFIQLKQEQAQLQKAYKDGAITLQEYSAETVRVENTQKKVVASYSQVQRSVTGLKNPIKELTESNKQLSAQFSQMGDKINLGGTSLTGFTSKITAMASPVGLAVGLVTALGSAYAQSSEGAKDLEFAQNELSAAFQIASDKLGDFLNTGKDGEGLFTRLTDLLIGSIGGSGALIDIKLQALGIEQLQDKQRELNKLKAQGNDRLQDNADLLTKINDSQTGYNEKVRLFAKIEDNLKLNGAEQVANLDAQIKILQNQFPITKDKEALEGKINDKIYERSQLEKQINRLMEANNRLASNTADAEAKAAAAQQKKLDTMREEGTGLAATDSAASVEDEAQLRADAQSDGLDREDERLKAHMDVFEAIFGKKTEISDTFRTGEAANEEQAAAQAERLQARRLATLDRTTKAAGQIFGKQSGAYKAIASAQALIQSYLSATEAFASLAGIPYVGPILGAIAAAAALASGLANVAAINSTKVPGFAGGGYTGHGHRLQPAGVVHAGEVVWSQDDVSSVGGPHIANAMRPTFRGYADGGVVTAASTAKFDAQISMADMIKHLPVPVLSMKEFAIESNRIALKEKATQI